MTTRAEFLSGLRAEMAKTRGLFAATVSERPVRPAEVAETLRRELAERWRETLDRFCREFERVGGVFHRAPTPEVVPDLVAEIARDVDAKCLVAWHPKALGADWSHGLTARGLEVHLMPATALEGDAERQQMRAVIADAEIGLTGVDLVVAETGSLVLISGAGRPRSTSLLPPTHIAVFDRTRLVESLSQVGVFLEAWHASAAAPGQGGAINIITGPSRTADIELTLTRGVHGPKDVHAIFVEGGLDG